MRNFLLVVGCFFLSLPLLAQTVSLNWGKTNYLDRKEEIQQIIGADSQLIYSLHFRKSGFSNPDIYSITAYDRQTLAPFFSKPLPMPRVRNKEATFENIFLLRNRLVLIASLSGEGSLTSSAYAFYLDSGVVSSDPPQLLIENERPTKKREGSFDMKLSADTSKVLVYYQLPFFEESNERITLAVFDDQLKPLWSKLVDLPYRDDRFTVTETRVHNDGTVYILGRVSEKRLNWSNENPGFKYVLLCYDHRKSALKEYNLDLAPKSISGIGFQFTPENKYVAVSGFYSENSRSEEEAAGFLFLKLDHERQRVVQTATTPFDRELLARLMTQKQVERNPELRNFQLAVVFPLENGQTLLVAEQATVRQICLTDPRTGLISCSDQYNFDDLLVTKLSAEGIPAWVRSIPKRQFSTDDEGLYLSFVPLFQNGTLHLFFNNHPKNKDLPDSATPKILTNPRKAHIAHVSVSGDGEVKKSVLKEEQNELIFAPRLVVSHNNLSNVIVSYSARAYQLGRLQLE